MLHEDIAWVSITHSLDMKVFANMGYKDVKLVFAYVPKEIVWKPWIIAS